MKIIKTTSYDEMSVMAANIIFATMTQDKKVNLSLTAGRSPQGVFDHLNPLVSDNKRFRNAHYFLFDETPIYNPQGVKVDNDTLPKLLEIFYTPANVTEDQLTNMDEDNYLIYDDLIAQKGGLDLMLIGIGEDGHFCANMPESTSFSDWTYRVKLIDDYPWNKPYQDSLGENHSTFMYTMGAKSVMRVKHLVLIANGLNKAKIIKEALEGPIVESCPSSILQLHPNITVILDPEAASLLSESTLEKYR